MHCVVTGGNVKVLAKAIHSLSRIGDELYVEPQEDGLALRSVNSSRSAYACFLFAPLFFSRYSVPNRNNFRCKMAIKSVQAVFRSLASLEKTVEKCHIELDEQKNRLTFTLHCKHGLLKTHNLSFQDSESLQAVFDKDSCSNVFRAQPRLLVDTVMHFPPSLEEVTVSVSDERMWVRNHVEEEAEQSKAMLTELCLASDEFDHFAIQAHSSVTFCLKELRGLLVFAESTGLPVSIYFDEPGSPVVLSVTDSVLEGNFVLATLTDDPGLRKNSSRRGHTQPPPPPDDFMNDDMDSYLIAMDTSIVPGPSTAGPPTPPLAGSTCSKRPVATNHRTRIHSEEEEEGEEEGDSEKAEDSDRPPNKKFRSLFFGSVLPPSSQMNTQPVVSQEVLASDSEDDSQDE
ncbi:cell cycle checkpoint control protein RAD9A [Parambassis ranga]|uniref:Cell cycle checkpoint control protein n=1 Tax=Parambassis ranga TaxID=210632 RepID=A0A6P7J735_9TELE|nr:cell cycle checkpoint control protein RAD9A [Parambassis ranga]